MRCPKCGFEVMPGCETECIRCGIVFAKYRPPVKETAGNENPPDAIDCFRVSYHMPASSSSRTVLITIAILSVMGAVLLVLIFGSRRQHVPLAPDGSLAVEDLKIKNSMPLPPSPAEPAESGSYSKSRKNPGQCGATPLEQSMLREADEALAKLKAGQLEGGVTELDALRLKLPVCAQVQIDPRLAEAHVTLGNRAFERERWSEASLQYGKAAMLAPESAEPYYGLGRLAEKKGDMKSARTEYLKAARRNVNEKTLERLFSMAYAANELDEAAAISRKLVKITNGEAKWKEWSERLSRERPAENSMQNRVNERFVIKYDGRENQDAAFAVQEALRDAFIDLTRELRVKPSRPLTVILYTRQQFFDVTRAPSWSGGIYDDKIRIPAGGLTRKGAPLLRRVVFHELVHALVSEKTHDNCPKWFNEGLAEYYEGMAGDAPDKGGGRWNGSTLKALEGPFTRLPTRAIGAAYDESRAAVSYIVEKKGENALQHILNSLADGKNMEAALRSVGLSYEN